MAKVFVFCIGGTGLRVMKSVVMMAAAGMKTNGYDIVPVIIDPHVDLEENTILTTTIGDYIKVYKNATSDRAQQLSAPEGFFNTKITRLEDLDNQQNSVSASMAEKKTFGQYLNVGKLANNDVNKFLIQTLYSQENLNNSLSVGFKGNPNVGTVVLNEMISGADWYDAFRRHCEKGDRIFIISSIFGGTGASGYPLLEKKIRDDQAHPQVQNAVMGAVTVLPYYSLDDPTTSGSDIDSSNFYTKTKAALSYYEKSVKSDYLYYVGEQSLRANYKNNEKEQKDKAHIVELVAASALYDFLSRPAPDTPQAMTRAIRENADALDMSSLGEGYKPMVKDIANMMIFDLLLDILPEEGQFPLKKTRGLNKDFYQDQPFGSLKAFVNQYHNWYVELSENNRGFSPLNKILRGEKLSNIVKGITLKAKNESYYLLKMIEAGNKKDKTEHDNTLRYLLDFAYEGITEYTKTI